MIVTPEGSKDKKTCRFIQKNVATKYERQVARFNRICVNPFAESSELNVKDKKVGAPNVKDPTKDDRVIFIEGTEEDVKNAITIIEDYCSNSDNFMYQFKLKRDLTKKEET